MPEEEIVGPSGAYVIPQWINEHGDVAGNAKAAGKAPFAFIYTNDKFSVLNTLLDTREGWEVYQAEAIDAAGNIAGWGCRPHPSGSGLDCAGLFLSPVPEPAAWAMWKAGTLCVWGVRSWAQRKHTFEQGLMRRLVGSSALARPGFVIDFPFVLDLCNGPGHVS